MGAWTIVAVLVSFGQFFQKKIEILSKVASLQLKKAGSGNESTNSSKWKNW